jgi:hypothetical protein
MVDYERLQDLLSTERLGSYLNASGGDLEGAFALYEWNIEASAAAVSLAAMLEVLVRNTLDRQLTAWADVRDVHDWLDAAPLDARAQRDIVKARQRAARGGRQVTHGHIVAELNLGFFWRYLVSRRYLTTLWMPNLRQAFPRADGKPHEQRRRVESDLEQLLFLRNRAAHHEPIHRRDLLADLRRCVELAGCIDAEAQTWVASRESVTRVVRKKPIGTRQR